MANQIHHTTGTIGRDTYLAPFIGTAAESAHTMAANQGVTLAKLRYDQMVRDHGPDAKGWQRGSYEAAIETHNRVHG
jgi:hypothetical protein